MSFHEKLKQYLKSTGLSQTELAERIGYSQTMTSRYLSSSKPNYEFLNALIKVFPEIDLNYLFKEDADEHLAEGGSTYSKDEVVLIDEIELRLHFLKEILTQKRHE